MDGSTPTFPNWVYYAGAYPRRGDAYPLASGSWSPSALRCEHARGSSLAYGAIAAGPAGADWRDFYSLKYPGLGNGLRGAAVPAAPARLCSAPLLALAARGAGRSMGAGGGAR